MRVAALYDVHGNLPALEAVLDEVRDAGVDQIIVGGDVYPGPMSEEALACLLELELPARFLRGNGEREVLALKAGGDAGAIPAPCRAAMRWVAAQLTPEHEQVIAGWPMTIELEVDGVGSVLFCHATPRHDSEIFTRSTSEDRLQPVFSGINATLVVCGHTHMPFDRTIGDVRVVNAGSVGMPFGEPGAYWLRLGPEVEPRHTRYDLAAAAKRVRATDYPLAEEFARRNVLEPPSELESLATLARAELD